MYSREQKQQELRCRRRRIVFLQFMYTSYAYSHKNRESILSTHTVQYTIDGEELDHLHSCDRSSVWVGVYTVSWRQARWLLFFGDRTNIRQRLRTNLRFQRK